MWFEKAGEGTLGALWILSLLNQRLLKSLKLHEVVQLQLLTVSQPMLQIRNFKLVHKDFPTLGCTYCLDVMQQACLSLWAFLQLMATIITFQETTVASKSWNEWRITMPLLAQ